jgi:hypothetical protein
MNLFAEDIKKKLIKQLHEYLKDRPEEATDFLDVVSQALKDYRESVKKERDTLAINSIGLTISFLGKESNERLHKVGADMYIPLLIDAFYYALPDPRNLNHGSVSFRERFKEFKDKCIEVSILTDEKWVSWLRDIKGKDYLEWMKKLLLPE